MSATSIDELLGFYRSPTGRRYLAFQQRLNALESGAISATILGLASGGSNDQGIPPEPPPSQALIEQRKHLLEQSWTRLTLGAALSGNARIDSNSLKSQWDTSMRFAAATKGPALDELQRQYGADLARFAAFHRTPAAMALLVVYATVAKDGATRLKATGNPVGVALLRSVAQHSAAWMAAYNAGRSPAPADHSSSRFGAATTSSLVPGTILRGTITTPEAWKQRAVVRRLASLPNYPFVNGMDFSPDGSMLAVATADHVNVWAVRGGRLLHTFEAADSGLNLASQAIRFSPNGLYLATCHGRSQDGGIVRIWSTQTWSYVRDIKGPHGCESLAFTPDNRSMLVAELTTPTSSEESLVAYDTDTDQELWGIRTGTFYVHTLAVSTNGMFAAIGGRVLNPASWNLSGPPPTFGNPPLANMPLIGIVDLRTHKLVRLIPHAVNQTFGNMDWKPDGSLLATIGDRDWDGQKYVGSPDTVAIIDVNTGELVSSETLKAGHSSIRYTRDGKYLLEGDSTGLRVGWGLRIWTGDHRSLVQTVPGEFDHLAASKDGHLFATDDSGWVSLFELR